MASLKYLHIQTREQDGGSDLSRSLYNVISLFIKSDCKLVSLFYLDSNIYWIISPCFHRVRPHDLNNMRYMYAVQCDVKLKLWFHIKI